MDLIIGLNYFRDGGCSRHDRYEVHARHSGPMIPRWSWMRYPLDISVSPIVSESPAIVINNNQGHLDGKLRHFNAPSFMR